jgi:hypothetical protein
MRIADVLRAMISMIDAAEQESAGAGQQPTVVVVNNPTHQEPAQEPAPQPVAQPAHALTPVAVDNKPESEKTTMVPPLQQKMELLKRAVSVDNEFNNGFDQIDQEEGKSHPDELEHIKKMAGLNPLIQQELANDDPLDQ